MRFVQIFQRKATNTDFKRPLKGRGETISLVVILWCVCVCVTLNAVYTQLFLYSFIPIFVPLLYFQHTHLSTTVFFALHSQHAGDGG